MNRRKLILQTLALRNQVDAILVELEGEEPAQVGCPHSPEMREDTTTGGGSPRSFFCTGCKKTSEEIAAEASS